MSLESTKGIVLTTIKYGDTSLIGHLYTENFGRKSFIFKGIRSKKSKLRPNILQPLFILNLQSYIKEGNELSLVKDASPDSIFSNFPYDVKKSAQALFIAEMLGRCLREEEANKDLFSFVKTSIEYFDLMEQGSSNFHILFLIKLSRHLGFYPSGKIQLNDQIFDLKEGIYKDHYPGHADIIDPLNSDLLDEILNRNYDQLSSLQLNHGRRNEILDFIIKFYSIHTEGVTGIKSFDVLKEIFL
jgi:DNA repair protein RecO (recombination protein O)